MSFEKLLDALGKLELVRFEDVTGIGKLNGEPSVFERVDWRKVCGRHDLHGVTTKEPWQRRFHQGVGLERDVRR